MDHGLATLLPGMGRGRAAGFKLWGMGISSSSSDSCWVAAANLSIEV